jgi:chaperone modulatory protein CbpM
MISVQEFVVRVSVDREAVERWIEAGWLVPQTEPELAFSEVDLSRATLIRELKHDFGVNDEGISLILHLLDQVHGLRRGLQELTSELRRIRQD